MTKCLSCGHSRHDLELNCPKCGSFYSVIDDIDDDFSPQVIEQNRATRTLLTVKQSIERVQQIGKIKIAEQKARYIIIGTIIFLIVAVIFL